MAEKQGGMTLLISPDLSQNLFDHFFFAKDPVLFDGWLLSGDPEDIRVTDQALKELFPEKLIY